MIEGIEKAKHLAPVVVTREDGSTYTRMQMVGSNIEPLQGKYNITTLLNSKEELDKYEDLLINLYEHEGKFYKKEELSAPSLGRTTYGGGGFRGLVEYKLHPSEIAYRKRVLKERGRIPLQADSDFKARYGETYYKVGLVPTKDTFLKKEVEKLNSSNPIEIHKKLDTPLGKKIKEKEGEVEDRRIEENRLSSKESSKKSIQDRVSVINNKLEGVDYNNETISSLYSKIGALLTGVMSYGSSIDLELTLPNGKVVERTLTDTRNWLKKTKEDLNPLVSGQKVPFTKMKVREDLTKVFNRIDNI